MTLKRRKVAILILGIIFIQILVNGQLTLFDKLDQRKPSENFEDNNYTNLKLPKFSPVLEEYVEVGNITDHIWSPDGTKIAYVMSPNGESWNSELWVADKSPNSAQLTNHQLLYTGVGAGMLYDWKDDWILFKTMFVNWGAPTTYNAGNELWKIRFDSTGLTQVTFTYTNGIRTGGSYQANRGTISWGTFISGTNLVYFAAHNGNGWFKSYVCNDDGTDNWQHRSNPDYAFTLDFSPTGNKILWGHASFWNNPTTLRASNVDGSGRNTIKTFTERTQTFVLADGNTVIWSYNDNIYAINMDGSNERIVIDDGNINRWWTYNPNDGQELVMGSNRSDGNMHTYRIKSDGTGITQLTDGPYMDHAPNLSPDGNYISYLRLPYDYDLGSSLYTHPYDLVVKLIGSALPYITVISPIQNEVFGSNAPDFQISISGSSINTTWYTLDGGLTNVTFTGLIGTILQTEWDKIGGGLVNLRFYINNTIGNETYSDVIIYKNYKPVLSGGKVSPSKGDQNTLFTFNVTYTDPDDDPPDFVELMINTSKFSMWKFDLSDIIYSDGVIYQYKGYLAPASYNYTYIFNSSDGIDTNSTSVFNNLEVIKTNVYEPQLQNPQVSPIIGNNFTMFNFTVWYFDNDNNLPIDINISINQNIYNMIKQDPFDINSTDGIFYYFNTTLDFGFYQFQINVSDGIFENSTSWIVGPEVTPLLNADTITLLTPSNTTSIFTGITNFTWLSLNEAYGPVNFTIQISNFSNFSNLITQIEEIEEIAGITNVLINIDFSSGIYYWRIRPNYYQFIGNWSYYFTFDFISNYYTPSLINPSVTPTVGDELTLFNFTVDYFDQDNNSPQFLNVSINGMSYAMSKLNLVDTNYIDGCTYQFLTLLPIDSNNYSYSFSSSDGKYSYVSSTYNNLEVNPSNYFNPQLVNPGYSPLSGDYETIFNFTIWYYDIDNNLPVFVNLIVGGTQFSMVQFDILDINATDGILFYFTTTLDFGNQSFMFSCSDGNYLNSTNWFIGPEVSPFLNINAITLLTPLYNDELYANLINFSWTSVDAVFGGINFTFQLSASDDFSTLLYEVTDINEMPNITYFPLNVNLPSGLYYWRVKPTYGEFYGAWSNYFQLNLLRNSFSPQLISYTVSALTGNQKTIFKFTVIYKDLDNNRPVFVKIIINGIQFFMEKTDPNDNDYTDGCMYQFLSLFAPSLEAYRYSFEWSDGIFTNATLTFNGPLVTSYIQEYDKTEGLNNRNSENIFIMIMSSAVGFCIVIPSILVTEVKVKHIKSNSNLKPKFKSKLKKLKKPKK